MTTTTDSCSTCGRPFAAHMWCAQCGRAMYQPEDPGRYKEYCSNACRQRAYRARGGRASGTRYESASARFRREQEEAWARQEARKERDRQRKRENRGTWSSPGEPDWCRSRATDDTVTARRRQRARLLFMRAMHHGTEQYEATACREKAEQMRAKYGL